jgi:hypothetical protein
MNVFNIQYSSRPCNCFAWVQILVSIYVLRLELSIDKYLETLFQVTLSCACFVVGISYGMSTGHSAVLLPHLQSENSSLVIDADTGSWIGDAEHIVISY